MEMPSLDDAGLRVTSADNSSCRSSTPKQLAARPPKLSLISTAVSDSQSSTPRASLLPTSSLVPSQRPWSLCSGEAKVVGWKPPLLQQPASSSWSHRSSPSPSASARSLSFGSLLPDTSLIQREDSAERFPSILASSLLPSEVPMLPSRSRGTPQQCAQASSSSFSDEGRILLPLGQPSIDSARPLLICADVAGRGVDEPSKSVDCQESLYAEALYRCQVACQAAESAHKDAEDRLAQARSAFEVERQTWEAERRGWQKERDRLQGSLDAALEALAHRLPPTGAPQVASKLLAKLPAPEQDSSLDLSASSASEPLFLSSQACSSAMCSNDSLGKLNGGTTGN
eukprot:TRINITY_DN95680_c0_g1_i1.p1 TRINITY_DN95680_c0_g1~~TRINITY_DN95680_c0_g1_i1.p1  ORF type:complete len:370 (-),score=49.36 TRINITY_DN95680_c0_g1_i1:238-1263(-)